MLKNNGTLYVKQRAGHLSYVIDPKGYRSMLAKSLTSDHSSHTSIQPDVIKAFTSDPVITSLSEYFLKTDDSKDSKILQNLSSILYTCITQEKPEVISTHTRLNQILDQSDFCLSYIGVCQLKAVLAYYYSSFSFQREESRSALQLLKMEFLLALKSQLENVLDSWQTANMSILVKYLQGDVMKGCNVSHLSAFVSWYDIPPPEEIAKISVEGAPTLPMLCVNLPRLPVSTVMKVMAAWQAAV